MTTWRKVRRITVAGQAEIWLVRDSDSGDEKVMKRLLPTAQLLDPGSELRRFSREVRCQSAMDHRGIMPILGHNFSANPPWYVMPKADRSLDDVIGDHPTGMPLSDAAAIILDDADLATTIAQASTNPSQMPTRKRAGEFTARPLRFS